MSDICGMNDVNVVWFQMGAASIAADVGDGLVFAGLSRNQQLRKFDHACTCIRGELAAGHLDNMIQTRGKLPLSTVERA